MSKPITPLEASQLQTWEFPPEVFDAFNELIAANFDGRAATVKQKDVAALVANKLDITTALVYSRRYLDVEEAYRRAGWEVEYDKPGYCESYEAYFTFTKRKGRDDE